MNEFRADLHCHTTCSDGSLTPAQIVQLAKEKGLTGLSITDHDTIAAYQTAPKLCAQAGLQLLTGVEFSAAMNGVSIHILGYGFDVEAKSVADLCAWHTNRRQDRNEAMLKLLAKQGKVIQYEELAASIPAESSELKRTIGRPHIALAMVGKGYAATPQEAFSKYIGEGRPCYVEGANFGVEETINAIHAAKGIAVIAHPHLIKNSEILQKLLTKEFDGIECYYGYFPQHKHKRWLKIAQKKSWLITGGSDYHGTAKPHIPLGCSWIDKTLFQAILDRLAILPKS